MLTDKDHIVCPSHDKLCSRSTYTGPRWVKHEADELKVVAGTKGDANEILCVTFSEMRHATRLFLRLALSKNVRKIFVSEPLFLYRSSIGF